MYSYITPLITESHAAYLNFENEQTNRPSFKAFHNESVFFLLLFFLTCEKCIAYILCGWVEEQGHPHQTPALMTEACALHSCWLLLHFSRHKVNRPLIFPLSKALCCSIIWDYCFLFLYFLYCLVFIDAVDTHLWPLQYISLTFQYLQWVQLWKMLKHMDMVLRDV